MRFAEVMQCIHLVGAVPLILVKYSRCSFWYHLIAGTAVNRPLFLKVFQVTLESSNHSQLEMEDMTTKMMTLQTAGLMTTAARLQLHVNTGRDTTT